MRTFLLCALSALLLTTTTAQEGEGAATSPRPQWMNATVAKLPNDLAPQLDETAQARLSRGLTQVSAMWREDDGDSAAFEAFVREHFVRDEPTRETMLQRLDTITEQMDGTMLELYRTLRQHTDLDVGPILPFDRILAGYDPSAHLIDDLFRNKLAFAVLLNFPLTTLDEKLAQGAQWSRRQWAEARLTDRFSTRVPAEVALQIASAESTADSYIAEYNIWMHHLIDDKGQRLFPPKLRLITHWNLRDELKAAYSEKNGIAKQRTIARVMERIVDQSIPRIVIDNPHVDWNPFTNEIRTAAVNDSDRPPPPAARLAGDREPDTRYQRLLEVYRAHRLADPYSPADPSLIARRFNRDLEIPEQRVRAMLEQVVGSPLVPQVAKLIEKRLGRKLEPFDIWYSGFRARGQYTEEQLDAITRERYPDAEAFARDMPAILEKLGFSKERSQYLAERIVVDPSRGAGHAFGAQRRGDKAHLRTRVERDGMNYKGYNIAIHELGHNVEQTFSLYDVDYNLLEGVPNTAFTEALAFVFQAKDLELLGLATPDARSRALTTLNDFWQAYEIGGVALVDMAVWRWMYDNPEATPAQLREATVRISKDIWNRYYAPVFGTKDAVLLGVYSHMISSTLYLPNYPIGRMIAHQIEEQIAKTGNLGTEFERMSVQGNITPDLWMQRATGAPVGPAALLAAAEKALRDAR